MSENQKSPFDKEPAEGSRETVDKQLEQQSRMGQQTEQDKPSGDQDKGKSSA